MKLPSTMCARGSVEGTEELQYRPPIRKAWLRFTGKKKSGVVIPKLLYSRTHPFTNKKSSLDQLSCFLILMGVLYCTVWLVICRFVVIGTPKSWRFSAGHRGDIRLQISGVTSHNRKRNPFDEKLRLICSGV